MATKSHPTAEELFSGIKAQDPTAHEPCLSLATVYNTLEAFTACGLARKIPSPSGSGPCRYDADTSEHVHFATSDGRVVDVPLDLSRRLLEQIPPTMLAEIEERMGIKVRGVTLQVVGCPQPLPMAE